MFTLTRMCLYQLRSICRQSYRTIDIAWLAHNITSVLKTVVKMASGRSVNTFKGSIIWPCNFGHILLQKGVNRPLKLGRSSLGPSPGSSYLGSGSKNDIGSEPCPGIAYFHDVESRNQKQTYSVVATSREEGAKGAITPHRLVKAE